MFEELGQARLGVYFLVLRRTRGINGLMQRLDRTRNVLGVVVANLDGVQALNVDGIRSLQVCMHRSNLQLEVRAKPPMPTS